MLQTLTLNNTDYVVIEKTAYEELLGKGDGERFSAEFVDKLFDAQTTGEKITLWRDYRGMTMTDLAKAVGVSQSYISDIENNKKDGSIKVIKAIVDVLHADIELII